MRSFKLWKCFAYTNPCRRIGVIPLKTLNVATVSRRLFGTLKGPHGRQVEWRSVPEHIQTPQYYLSGVKPIQDSESVIPDEDIEAFAEACSIARQTLRTCEQSIRVGGVVRLPVLSTNLLRSSQALRQHS